MLSADTLVARDLPSPPRALAVHIEGRPATAMIQQFEKRRAAAQVLFQHRQGSGADGDAIASGGCGRGLAH